MERDPILSSLLAEFVIKKFQAVTIAKLVTIGSHVVDACVIEATPEAAMWYGMQDPKELIGSWQSLLQHPDDAKLGHDLSLRHRLGYTVPTRYVARIRQGQSRTFRPVLKDITRLTLEDELYWVTVLQEPTEAPLAETIDIDQVFPLLVPAEEIARHDRPFSVADLERIFHDNDLPRKLLTSPLLSNDSQISDNSVSQKSDTANKISFPVEQQNLAFALRPGQTYRMPTGRFIHWCTVCLNLWRSNDEWPTQCGHRTCHSPYWRTGKSET